jgi:hypothetical protein
MRRLIARTSQRHGAGKTVASLFLIGKLRELAISKRGVVVVASDRADMPSRLGAFLAHRALPSPLAPSDAKGARVLASTEKRETFERAFRRFSSGSGACAAGARFGSAIPSFPRRATASACVRTWSSAACDARAGGRKETVKISAPAGQERPSVDRVP